MRTHTGWSRVLAIVAAIGLVCFDAMAAELTVRISGGFRPAYDKLFLDFQNTSGNRLVTIGGASFGSGRNAIPNQVKDGAVTDLVILDRRAIDTMVKDGTVLSESVIDLGHAPLGLAVKAGAPKPDIFSVAAFKQTLLDAKTLAYHEGVSGVYVSGQMLERLGIADSMRSKHVKITSGPGVPASVASGQAEICIQPLSELLPALGITVVGPIPAEVQMLTTFSVAITTSAKFPVEAKRFIEYLRAEPSRQIIEDSGLRAR
jgi:molybdate transport system substrate-binding protein